MARLTTTERDKLPDSDFALPGRNDPIEDEEHGRKAIQLGARQLKAGHITADEYRRLRARVHLRYPDIEIAGEKDGATENKGEERKG